MLPECLQTVFQLDYPNVEVMIVDNASTDHSRQYVTEHFPQVIWIQNQENLRFAEGNNVGIRYALEHGADYIFLLNNDTTIAPEALTELVQVLKSDPTIGVAGPKIYYADEPDRLWFAGGRTNLIWGHFWHRGIRQRDHGQFDQIEPVDFITGCAMLVRASVIQTVGLMDPHYFIYGEDVDWCLRMRQHGFQCVYVPSATVWHKISASSGQVSVFKIQHRLKSQFQLLWRFAPRWALFTTIPLFLIGDSLRIIYLILIRKIRNTS
ncbi:MAG: glycosyltransferase family 2 protein [Gemmatimonadetes bacterium]|nr:MAG: glycosyltransferase family 2 protein [Gemmatimonadota bacterium]